MTGAELKRLRKARKLTQSQLAEMAGLSSKNVIANYESDGKKGSRKIPPPMIILFNLLLK
jgi:transcriptional regulator with XRE-family HTH domain